MSISSTSQTEGDKVNIAYTVAQMHYSSKRYEQAEVMARQALSFQPRDIVIRCHLLELLGDSLAGQGYHGHALHAFVNAGRAAQESGAREPFQGLMKLKISQLNSSDPCFQAYDANCKFLLDKAKTIAMTALRTLQLDDEQKAFLVCELARNASARGDFSFMNSLVQSGQLSLPTKNPDIHASLKLFHGRVCTSADTKDTAKALALAAEMIALNPCLDSLIVEAHVVRAEALFMEEKYDEALQEIRFILPTARGYHFVGLKSQEAACLNKMKKYQEMAQAAQEGLNALDTVPDEASALFQSLLTSKLARANSKLTQAKNLVQPQNAAAKFQETIDLLKRKLDTLTKPDNHFLAALYEVTQHNAASMDYQKVLAAMTLIAGEVTQYEVNHDSCYLYAQAHCKLKNYEKVITFVNGAFSAIVRKGKNFHLYEMNSLVKLIYLQVFAYNATKEHEKAKYMAQAGILLTEQTPDKVMVSALSEQLKYAKKKLGEVCLG